MLLGQANELLSKMFDWMGDGVEWVIQLRPLTTRAPVVLKRQFVGFDKFIPILKL